MSLYLGRLFVLAGVFCCVLRGMVTATLLTGQLFYLEKFVQESFVAGYLLFNNSIFGFGKYSSRKCFYLILYMMRDELIYRQIETTNFSKQDTKIIML